METSGFIEAEVCAGAMNATYATSGWKHPALLKHDIHVRDTAALDYIRMETSGFIEAKMLLWCFHKKGLHPDGNIRLY